MNTKKVWTWSRVAQDAVEIEVKANPMSGSTLHWYLLEPLPLSKGYKHDGCIGKSKCFDTKLKCLTARESELRKVRLSATRLHKATLKLLVKELSL